MSSSDTPARRTASRIAMPPSSGADSGESPPRNRPIGVRTADTMTGIRDVSAMASVREKGADARWHQPRKAIGTAKNLECQKPYAIFAQKNLPLNPNGEIPLYGFIPKFALPA
jgi:hypothetical protein